MAEKDTTPTPPPKKRIGVRRLKSAEDIRQLVAKLIKARLAGDTDTDTLRAVVWAGGLLLKCMEAGLMEDRLAAIEQTLKERKL